MHIVNHKFLQAPARRPWMSISIVATGYPVASKGLTIGDDASAR